MEVKIPENAELLYEGRYYLLAKAKDYPDSRASLMRAGK